MREFLRIAVVAVAVLAAYFGYVYLNRPQAYTSRVRDAGLVRGLLDDYRAAKGRYPVLDPTDVPIAQLLEALATSGVSFRSRIRFSDLDREARYVSVSGRSFGLLYHFSQFGQPVTCIVGIGARDTGWWGQPPTCPW